MQLLTMLIIVSTGICSQYDPGVMETAVRNHTRYGHLTEPYPQADGFIAGLECADLGKVVYLKPTDSEKWERFIVGDCAGRADGGYAWMVNKNVLAELGAKSAERWNTVGKIISCQLAEEREVNFF